MIGVEGCQALDGMEGGQRFIDPPRPYRFPVGEESLNASGIGSATQWFP
jgi:hypothetical protein